MSEYEAKHKLNVARVNLPTINRYHSFIRNATNIPSGMTSIDRIYGRSPHINNRTIFALQSHARPQ